MVGHMWYMGLVCVVRNYKRRLVVNECSCMEWVCAYCINCTVICLLNEEMHRCTNFLADGLTHVLL